jgi:hypothetical protein
MASSLEMDIQAEGRQAITLARGQRSQCVGGMELFFGLRTEKDANSISDMGPLGARSVHTPHRTELSTPVRQCRLLQALPLAWPLVII